MSSCEKVNINNINFNAIVVEKDHDSYTTTTSSVDSRTSKSSSSSSACTWNAYVVLIAAFIAYMLATILTSCFGVFFDNMASDLGLSKSQVAFIGACLSSLDNLLGPVASVLINRRGCRFTTILGGIFLSAGLIGSAFVNQFWLIGLLMGFVSGLGSSLVVVSTVVEVTYHFEDKPSFASGFVISGCCVGQSVFSLIIIKLNEIYGRGGCFLIIGGLLLNIVVCGAVFKPLSWEREGYDESDSEGNDEDDDDAVEEELDMDDDEEEAEEEEDCDEISSHQTQTKQLTDSNDNLKQQSSSLSAKEQSLNVTTLVIDTINDNKIVKIDKCKSKSELNLFQKFLKFFKSNSVTNNKNRAEKNNNLTRIIVNNGTDDFNMNNVSKNKMSRSYSISSPVPLLTIEHKHYNHHQHHHSRHHRHNNLPYFANKFPLDFRNIYYKSLINLNTRLMADSPLSHSKDTIQKQQIYKKDISHINNNNNNNNISLLQVDDDSNVISLSCPNLTNTQISDMNDPQLTVEALNYRLNKYKSLMNKKRHFNQLLGINDSEDYTESEEDMERSKSKCLNICKLSSSIKFIKKVSKRLLRSIIESLKLFKIFKYTIFVLCIFNAGLFYESPFYFINSYMTENGFSEEKAGTVTVAIGVVCIFAAIGYGYVGDFKRINWIILTSISLFLTGICNFLIPLCIQNYLLTMLTIVSLGVFIMSNDVLMPMICVNTVGPDDFVSAYGLIFFCQGISSLIGPPILGMIVDYTGSYAYSYNIGGIGFCISGAILLINLLYKSKNENENNNNSKLQQQKQNEKQQENTKTNKEQV